jgi:hypothetical protein
MSCDHEAAREKVWMETEIGATKKHPYCRKCGTLKNVSSDRGRKISHFLIVLSKLRKVYRLTDVQIRLIVKELESREDFRDLWWVSYTAQRKVFKEIVRKYAGVSEEVFEKLL